MRDSQYGDWFSWADMNLSASAICPDLHPCVRVSGPKDDPNMILQDVAPSGYGSSVADGQTSKPMLFMLEQSGILILVTITAEKGAQICPVSELSSSEGQVQITQTTSVLPDAGKGPGLSCLARSSDFALNTTLPARIPAPFGIQSTVNFTSHPANKITSGSDAVAGSQSTGKAFEINTAGFSSINNNVSGQELLNLGVAPGSELFPRLVSPGNYMQATAEQPTLVAPNISLLPALDGTQRSRQADVRPSESLQAVSVEDELSAKQNSAVFTGIQTVQQPQVSRNGTAALGQKTIAHVTTGSLGTDKPNSATSLAARVLTVGELEQNSTNSALKGHSYAQVISGISKTDMGIRS